MLPGDDIVKKCPNCQGFILEPTMVSGNTFGAEFWSDGFMKAPMYPEYPWLVECPFCQYTFWIDESNELDRIAPGTVPDAKYRDARKYITPDEARYLEVLQSNKLPRKKEEYLRIRAWWAANDAIRFMPAPPQEFAFSEGQVKNLLALNDLLKKPDPQERLMRSELMRELGRFDESRALLEHKFPSKLQPVAKILKNLCEEKNRFVANITENL